MGSNTTSKKTNKQNESQHTLLINYPDHEWNDAQDPGNPDKGWRTTEEKGDDGTLLRSSQDKLLQYISEGINLALEKIKNKLGPGLSDKVTLDEFKVMDFDIVPYTDQDGIIRQVIFPVELKADISAGGGKIYSLNINIDNALKKDKQGPRGPHVGAEITGNRKAGNTHNLHAHILLKNLFNKEDVERMPGRNYGQYKTFDLALEKVKNDNYTEVTAITKSMMFSAHKTSYALDGQRLSFRKYREKKPIRQLLREEFNLFGRARKVVTSYFRNSNVIEINVLHSTREN